MIWLGVALGILLFARGFGMQLLADRREFYRTNASGLLEVKNFRTSVGFRTSDYVLRWTARTVMIVGLMLVVTGVFMTSQPPSQPPARGGASGGGVERGQQLR